MSYYNMTLIILLTYTHDKHLIFKPKNMRRLFNSLK